MPRELEEEIFHNMEDDYMYGLARVARWNGQIAAGLKAYGLVLPRNRSSKDINKWMFDHYVNTLGCKSIKISFNTVKFIIFETEEEATFFFMHY